jgi:hypothetical protein
MQITERLPVKLSSVEKDANYLVAPYKYELGAVVIHRLKSEEMKRCAEFSRPVDSVACTKMQELQTNGANSG